MANYREERIRRLAHEIWEREGYPHGRDAEHWRMATEAYEAELAQSRLDHSGEVMGATRTNNAAVLPTVAADGSASQAVATPPATPRKRRTKAEMEAARTAEAATPATKRKRRTKAEMAAAAAGLAGAAAAVATAAVAVSKRRRGTKEETTGDAAPAVEAAPRRTRRTRSGTTLTEAEPASVTFASDVATSAAVDPSADFTSAAASDAVPDPAADTGSNAALETFPENALDAQLPSDRVAD